MSGSRSGKYIPPHLRGRPSSQQNKVERKSLSALAATKGHLQKQPGINETKVQEDEDKERHPDLDSKETLMTQNYFNEYSPTYKEWTKVRQEAYENIHIARFFEKKKENSK